MNEMSIGAQLDTQLGSGGASTPFLGSYQGLDSRTLNALVALQNDYRQQAPTSNQSTALQDLYSARDASDPQLRAALIADAVRQLTPEGAQPLQLGADAPASGFAAPQSAAYQSAAYQGAAYQSAAPRSAYEPAAPTDSTGSDPSLSVSGNSIDTGRYTITASQSQAGQLTIHDNQTGKDTVVWGDPHITANGKDTAQFQHNGLTLKLDDGTTVQIQPTAVDGGGHSYINQVAVTKGDQAVTMSGFHSGSLHTSDVMNGQAQGTEQAFNAPNEDTVFEGDDDNLYFENANGSMGGQIVNSGSGEVNLDQTAGSGSGGGTASGASSTDSMTALQQAIQNYTSGFMQTMMNSLFAQIMSNSGFNS